MMRSEWKLSELIEWLSAQTGAHICIWRLSGAFSIEPLRVPTENSFHEMPFCHFAKSTPEGMRRCVFCKDRANWRAMAGEAFCGICINGLFEVTRPVMINGRCICIIYIGNLIMDCAKANRKLRMGCRRTGLSEEKLRALRDAKVITDSKPYEKMAELIESYIRLLYPLVPHKEESAQQHWAVSVMKSHAEKYFEQEISLRQLAKLCYVNEQYAGRLFKQQVGCSFHEYLNELRLQKAEQLLRTTDWKILRVAMESGFRQAAYLNRMFYRKYGESPSAYRERARKNDGNLK